MNEAATGLSWQADKRDSSLDNGGGCAWLSSINKVPNAVLAVAPRDVRLYPRPMTQLRYRSSCFWNQARLSDEGMPGNG